MNSANIPELPELRAPELLCVTGCDVTGNPGELSLVLGLAAAATAFSVLSFI